MCSVVEGTEQCHTPLDPVVLRLAGGNLHRHHIVSRVASSGESAWEEEGREGRREGGREGGRGKGGDIRKGRKRQTGGKRERGREK